MWGIFDFYFLKEEDFYGDFFTTIRLFEGILVEVDFFVYS